MNTILSVCCANRSKDDISSSDLNITKPLDFIRSKPELVRILKWFDELEDSFRVSFSQANENLETIVEVLQKSVEEEVVELGQGGEIVSKVVSRDIVSDILHFDQLKSNAVQEILEGTDFFQVKQKNEDRFSQYDFTKVILFCILFCHAQPHHKINFLFYLMCDGRSELISNRSGQVKTIIAQMTIISCMIPSENLKAERAQNVTYEERQEFDHLHLSFCCSTQTFNKFTTYLQNSKLFSSIRGPLDINMFRKIMQEQDYILVDSAMIRHEFTYFVYFQMLPEHAQYFNRPTFLTQASYSSVQESFQQRSDRYLHHDQDNNNQMLLHGDQQLIMSDRQAMPKKNKKQQQQQRHKDIMNSMRQSIDLESANRNSKRQKRRSQTRGGREQSPSNDQYRAGAAESGTQNEDSILQANRSQLLRSINENDENFARIKAKAAKKGNKKTNKGVKGGAQYEDAKHSSDDYVEQDSDDDDEDVLRIGGANKYRKKDEIDIMADDTIPVKKNKNQLNLASDRSNEPDGIRNNLNRSGTRSNNQLDRSSVKSGISRKRGPQTIEDYLTTQFGIQFTELVLLLSDEQQAEFTLDESVVKSNIQVQDRKIINKREKRFQKNKAEIDDPNGFIMPFPGSMETYPTHLREVFQFMQQAISADDLVQLQDGETSAENIINVYFKILEKINLVLNRAQDFLRAQIQREQNITQDFDQVVTQKVLYCNTSFIRDFKNCVPNNYDNLMSGPETEQKRRFSKILKDIMSVDVVLIPFYPEINNPNESEQQQTPMLVELKPRSYQATLYMQAGNRLTRSTQGAGATPNPTEQTADMISEEVMKIFTNCAKSFGEEFNAEMVDGGTCEVCVSCEEDYMVAMAYVADCHTYKREVNLESNDWDRERNKMVDLYLRLLHFQ